MKTKRATMGNATVAPKRNWNNFSLARLSSVSIYLFNVFGGAWTKNPPPHLSQLPFKDDAAVGNDVLFGRECRVMPGVHTGGGAIIAAYSVAAKDILPREEIRAARILRKRKRKSSGF